jgi:hypothetical protein
VLDDVTHVVPSGNFFNDIVHLASGVKGKLLHETLRLSLLTLTLVIWGKSRKEP